MLNTTGTEVYDVALYLLDSEGGIVTTITDTTAPTATILTCGYEYKVAVVASDSDEMWCYKSV